jgi:soluble P-type ATPase
MKRNITAALLAPLAIGLAACDVDQTKEAELPEVEVQGGQVPEFDVETADVDVGTEKKTIEVPDVDVTMPGDAEGKPVTGNE